MQTINQAIWKPGSLAIWQAPLAWRRGPVGGETFFDVFEFFEFFDFFDFFYIFCSPLRNIHKCGIGSLAIWKRLCGLADH